MPLDYQMTKGKILRKRGGYKHEIKLKYKTWAKWNPFDETISIVHFSSDIIVLHPDNTYTIYGGWLSNTDVSRLNEYAPGGWYTKNEQLYLYSPDSRRWEFFRGICVDRAGYPLNSSQDENDPSVIYHIQLRDYNNRAETLGKFFLFLIEGGVFRVDNITISKGSTPQSKKVVIKAPGDREASWGYTLDYWNKKHVIGEYNTIKRLERFLERAEPLLESLKDEWTVYDLYLKFGGE